MIVLGGMHVRAGDSRMPRLLGSGASVASPYQDEEEFKSVLSNLQPGHSCRNRKHKVLRAESVS